MDVNILSYSTKRNIEPPEENEYKKYLYQNGDEYNELVNKNNQFKSLFEKVNSQLIQSLKRQKEIEFEINGKKYIMNANTFGETKEVTYNIKMQSGWNYLKITATTVRNAVDTSYWKYEF